MSYFVKFMVFAFIDTIKRGRLREFRRSRLKVGLHKEERERESEG